MPRVTPENVYAQMHIVEREPMDVGEGQLW